MAFATGFASTPMRRLFILILVLLASMSRPAAAHDVPPSMVMLDIGRDVIMFELELPLGELGTALGLPSVSATDAVIPRYGERIERYVGDRMQVHTPDGRSFVLRVDKLAMKATGNPNWTSNDWVVVSGRLTPAAGASTQVLLLDYDIILQRVMSHQALIYVRRDVRNGLLGDKPLAVSTAGFGHTHITLDGSEGSWWKGFRSVFSLGMRHIAEGTDHLLFLLALLLPAPLMAVGGRWSRGPSTRATVGAIVTVVSGFTIGHSISLVLGCTGWVAVPSKPVELLIAISILVSAAHAWRPLFAGRETWIASAFGLVHGLAFAEALSGLAFDSPSLGISLLAFNLGIETMQLLVIAGVLPLLVLCSTSRHYARVRVAGAAFAAACALGWILERAFGMANPLQSVAAWMAPPPTWFTVSVGFTSILALVALLRRFRAPS